jgi:hypothetical protein
MQMYMPTFQPSYEETIFLILPRPQLDASPSQSGCSKFTTLHFVPYNAGKSPRTDNPNIHIPMRFQVSTNAPCTTMSGPGKMPYHPNPIPKTALPSSNLQSPGFGSATSIVSACFDAPSSLYVVHAIMLGISPPSATNASVGSKCVENGRDEEVLDYGSLEQSCDSETEGEV